MVRAETVAAWAMGVVVAFVVLAFIVVGLGVPKVASCVASQTPALKVEVATNRAGSVQKRHLFGCTLYSYRGPPAPSGAQND